MTGLRKMILTCLVLLLPLNGWAAEKTTSGFAARIDALERKSGGRIGVTALNTANGQRLEYRGDERFALCSTFKLLLVASVLARVDAGSESLDRAVRYSASDMLEYAPIAKLHLPEGKMTVSQLSAAAIQYSDNTAANLLLDVVDGPEGLTRYLRSLGDTVTRLDRIEPDMSSDIAGDERDTTTPSSMLATMRMLLVDEALARDSKNQLITWLVGNTTGDDKLRAGMDPSWKVGDKTGSGFNGTSNDVAIVWPSNKKPFLITVYYSGSTKSKKEKNEVIAEVGRIVGNTFYK